MNQEVKVSIICNVYNHEKYIRDALDGFVMQKTDFPFEVLVHDDASTDSSAEIIREYEKKYPDIIKPIYQTENQYSKHIGITSTFQVPRVKGKYIATCEGDDYWTDPLKLQKQVDFMEENPEYTMCASSVVWMDMRDGKTISLCCTEVDQDVSLEEIILEKRGRVFQYATILVKSEIFSSRPDWTYKFGVGDTPLEMYAAMCGKVRMLADSTAVYRNHAAGSWTSRIDEDVSYKVNAFQKFIVGLNAFNESTGYQYDQVVSRRIKQIKYNCARAQRDWKTMRSQELDEIYRSKRIIAKVSDMLYCKMPRLQQFIYKLLR